MACYWASCSSGLQFAVVSELEKLEGTCVISDSLILGGVLFSTLSTPTEICKLRSADNIYAFLGHFQGVPAEKDPAVSYLKELAKKVDWELPLDLFRQWQSHEFGNLVKGSAPSERVDLACNKVNQGPTSFRVSCDRACVRMKKHGFTSMEAAAALGEGIYKIFGWPADMCCYDLEVLAWIRDGEALLALALIYSGKKRKNITTIEGYDSTASFSLQNSYEKASSPSIQESDSSKRTLDKPSRPSRADSQLYSWRQYRKALVGTSLKPSIANALLQLGCVLPGSIIFDPMCGCGTIPLEAADWLGNQVMCVAGDIAYKAVDAASENIKAPGAVGLCDVLRWDAANLPLRSGVVDCIVCDMPFGVRCGSTRAREWLCPKVVQEVVRVLRLGTGVAVLLGQSKAMRNEIEVKQEAFLQLIKHLPIEMEGLRVEIFVVQRTMEPSPAPTYHSNSLKGRKREHFSGSSTGKGSVLYGRQSH